MLTTILNRTRVRLVRAIRGFEARTEGIAAVEFALIVPIMATLFIGAVEMSQAVTVNRRVTQVGSTTGDLVARADTNILATDIVDIMKVGSYLLNPYPATTLKVDISVVSSTASSATTTSQKWICSYDGANPGNTNICTCPNSAYTIPAGLLSKNDSIVIANVKYGYKPPLFDVFMKSAWGGGAGGVYTMTETVYLKPRANCPQITKADLTTCGC